jgi:pyrimidine operon attenuation protein/uracil phosphoribosyltransferase
MTSPSSSGPPPEATLVFDEASIDRALKRIAHEIIERTPQLDRVALIGVPSRGVLLAQRLAAHIQSFAGVPVQAGAVDVSMHRDDLRRGSKLRAIQPTQLPPALEAMTIILTDDVLFSGRTIRAAMDALASFGRPARIQLAVLIDRGHRELPIRADYVGKNLPTAYAQRVFVRMHGQDEIEGVWLDKTQS